MKHNNITHKTVSPVELRQKFLNWRKTRAFGAAVTMASLSTLRANQSADDKDANHRITTLVNERVSAMNDSLDQGDAVTVPSGISQFDHEDTSPHQGFSSAASYVLTREERNQLKRDVLARRIAVAAFKVDIARRGAVLLLTA